MQKRSDHNQEQARKVVRGFKVRENPKVEFLNPSTYGSNP